MPISFGLWVGVLLVEIWVIVRRTVELCLVGFVIRVLCSTIRIVRCSLFVGFEEANRHPSGHDDCDFDRRSTGDDPWEGVLPDHGPWKNASWEGDL